MSRTPYTCPRCDYQTGHKYSMINHFKRKNVCPDVNDLELTDEIKQKILDSRVYHKKKEPTSITNNINNIQNIQNIFNIDPDVKINRLMDHMNKDMPNLLEHNHFRRMKRSMITHKDREDADEECRHIDDLFKEIIDFLQSFFDEDDPENNVYNCFIKANMFHIYDEDCWEKRTVPNGMKQFIKTLKTMIFDAYEVCLIRQMTEWKKRQKAIEALKAYYSLICSFNNKPTFLEGRDNDNKLLYNKNDHQYMNDNYSSYEYIDQLQTIWLEVTKDMKDYKKDKNSKQLKDIMTNHSNATLKNLDSQLKSTVEGNVEFQQTMLQTI